MKVTGNLNDESYMLKSGVPYVPNVLSKAPSARNGLFKNEYVRKE